MEKYKITIDNSSNGILVKEGSKLIQAIALPPHEGCYLVRLSDEKYECDFEGLVAIVSSEETVLHYKGKILDTKKRKTQSKKYTKQQLHDILKKIYDRHDVYCNQKYDRVYPYSLHLKAVVAQAHRYQHLILEHEKQEVYIAAGGHDLIEDARWTYNDVKQSYGLRVADIIYACTELRGHDRPERHGEEFFTLLKENRLAVFVKLCDIMANALFSRLTNSSMFEKYGKEFPHLQKELRVIGEYEELWDDLRNLLKQ